MGTKLEKTVKRDTTINGVEAIVAIGPEGFTFNAKGGRTKFTVPFSDIVDYVHGVAVGAGDKDTEKYISKHFAIN